MIRYLSVFFLFGMFCYAQPAKHMQIQWPEEDLMWYNACLDFYKDTCDGKIGIDEYKQNVDDYMSVIKERLEVIESKRLDSYAQIQDLFYSLLRGFKRLNMNCR